MDIRIETDSDVSFFAFIISNLVAESWEASLS